MSLDRFYRQNPAPWHLRSDNVIVAANGEAVFHADIEDEDDHQFWQGLVDAVNAARFVAQPQGQPA